MPLFDSTAIRDTYLYAHEQRLAHGTDSTLFLSSFEYAERRFTLLDFPVPAGPISSVTDATLSMQCFSDPWDFPQGPFGIRTTDRTWAEGSSWMHFDGSTQEWYRFGCLGTSELDQTPMGTFYVTSAGTLDVPFNAYGMNKIKDLINDGSWTGLVLDATVWGGQWGGYAKFISLNNPDPNSPRLRFNYS